MSCLLSGNTKDLAFNYVVMMMYANDCLSFVLETSILKVKVALLKLVLSCFWVRKVGLFE